jgi:hypothetical protein
MSLVFFVLLLAAPPAEPAATLRPAEAILADYAQAVGGRDAWKRLRTLHATRSLTVAGQGASGTDEHWATADGKNLSESTLTGVGSFRMGYDGRVAWSQDPIFGLRKLKGAELEESLINGAWNAEPNLASLYAKVTSVPPPKDAAPGLECIEMHKKVGKPTVLCFDAKTHLRALQTGVQSSPGGEIPYKIEFGDWREVSGIKLWFSEKMTAGPSTIEARMTSVKFGEKIPASKFRMPKP